MKLILSTSAPFRLLLLTLFVAVAFTACTGGEVSDTPAEDGNGTEVNMEPDASQSPDTEAAESYADGYADFVPPTKGELLPQSEWGNALIGSWLTYGFDIEGEMTLMLETMESVDTYNADGTWSSVTTMPFLEGEPMRGQGTWRLEVDNLRINEEDPIVIVEMSQNHIGYNMPSDEVVEGVSMGKVMYYRYRVPTPTL